MHEASLVHSLLQQVADLRREHGAQRVTRICVSVGEFAGVEPDLFSSAFDLMSPDSVARGASLELRSVPLIAQCDSCEHQFAVERFVFVCPRCEQTNVHVIQGEQLTLESVTLEDDFAAREPGQAHATPFRTKAV